MTPPHRRKVYRAGSRTPVQGGPPPPASAAPDQQAGRHHQHATTRMPKLPAVSHHLPGRKVLVALEADEKIIVIAHHHWIGLLKRWLIPGLLWLVVSAVFLARLPGAGLDLLNGFLLVVGLGLGLALAYVYFDWANDHLVVTTRRVIFIDEVLFFSNRQVELTVDNIENVNINTESVIARQFNYGDVVVQTASRLRNIHAHTITAPHDIQRLIMAQVLPVRKRQDEGRVRDMIRSQVLHAGEPPRTVAPVHRLPQSFFGRGFTMLFPPNPHKEGDSIIWHKHWTWGFVQLSQPTLLLAILLVGRWVLADTGVALGAGDVLFWLGVGGVVLWMIYEWWDWLDDVYIISPSEVVDIERHPLGQEARKQASLAAILNVTSRQPNLVARLFNYGDVYLTTAGGSGEFSFSHVPAPEDVQAVVFDYLESFRRQQKEKERFAVLDLLHHYHDMHADPSPAPPAPPAPPDPQAGTQRLPPGGPPHP